MVVIVNKRNLVCIFIFAMCLLVGCYIHSTSINSFKTIDKEELLNSYKLNIRLLDDEKKLKCKELITYKNNSNEYFKTLYFHIYPNAFSSKEFAPFESSELESAYPNGFDKGFISFNKIVGKNDSLKYKIIGSKNDILEVTLSETLKPKESYNLYFEFEVKLPNSLGRFGYGDYTINATNFFPIACVYDKFGWNKKSYETIGDPFYSEVSNFNVKISCPQKYDLATTGKIEKEIVNSGNNIYDVKGNNIRDFAFILSDKFKVLSTQENKTKIFSYYFNEDLGVESLEIAKDSLKIFNKLFGEYPYDTYSVVASDFFIGGMEYPNLVMIDKTLYRSSSKFFLEYVIAHETAHQWWYSVIGNNEINEPWLDEALTEYSTIVYFEKKYGEEVKNRLIKDIKCRVVNKPTKSVFKKTVDFNNSQEYGFMCI